MRDFSDMAAQYDARSRGAGNLGGQGGSSLPDRVVELAQEMRLLREIKPVFTKRYLIKGWLDCGSASVVYGESNLGKTFLVLDMALHIAARRTWHGCRVAGADGSNDPGAVIYVAAEGGSGLNNRVEAIRRDNPSLLEEANFILLPTGLDLRGPSDGAALAQAVAARIGHAGLIVVDTLARTMGDGDENTAKDMGSYIRNIDLLRAATGAHVMVIHHSGKDRSKGARGSGALRAAVDTEIELTRSGAVIMAETRKQRDMPSGKVFAYTLRSVLIGQDEDGEAVTSAVVQEVEPMKKATRLTGKQKIAMRALDETIARHGGKKKSDLFPQNRHCVSLVQWRESCDRHSLSDGNSESAGRQAFGRVWKALQEQGFIKIVDGYVWKCSDDE